MIFGDFMIDVILKEKLLSEGASLVGFCDLGVSPIEDQPYLTHAVSIVVKLSDSILKTIKDRPSISYFQHYRTANYKLDQLAFSAVSILEKNGYNAFPIAASQSIPTNKFSGIFQHKTCARKAGLGYIGKNSLFITKEFGSKLRLATVLTDAPLFPDKPLILEGCGNCDICKNACPCGAIYGENFDPENPCTELFDKEKCSRNMKNYNDVGRGAVCGICMKVCPKNKLY